MLSLADFIAVALVTGGHDFTNPNIQTMHSWICPCATIPKNLKVSRIPYTLQKTNIIPLKKEYHRLKNALGLDMSSDTIRTQRVLPTFPPPRLRGSLRATHHGFEHMKFDHTEAF